MTLFMRMIRDDNAALVTAATGALHALVQGHKAYVPWIVQIQGVQAQLMGAWKGLHNENMCVHARVAHAVKKAKPFQSTFALVQASVNS